MFTRRVSFNDISPDLIDPFNPQHVPVPSKRLRKIETNSILKASSSLSINQISDKTINYHENQPESQESPQPQRRLSNMSDSEILKLDKQFDYNSQNLENFKFNQTTVYYSSNRRGSSSMPSTSFKQVKSNSHLSKLPIHKSISINVQHESFLSYKIGRRILLTLNFKNHSWNSLNWLIYSTFLSDNDHLIISVIDANELNLKLAKNRVFKKCLEFLRLIQSSFSNLVLKISLEYIFLQSQDTFMESKSIVKNLVAIYQPHLILVGNKSKSLNFKYFNKLRQKNIVKLSSYMLKSNPVPIIFINNLCMKNLAFDSSDSNSIDSLNIYISDNCSQVIASSEETLNETTDELKYLNMMKEISDNSIKETNDYLNYVHTNNKNNNDVSPLSSPKIQFEDSVVNKNYTAGNSVNLKKFRSINDSTTNIHKVKSLLDDTPLPSGKNSVSNSRKNSAGTTNSSDISTSNKRKNSSSSMSHSKKGFFDKIDFSLSKSFEKIGFKKKNIAH